MRLKMALGLTPIALLMGLSGCEQTTGPRSGEQSMAVENPVAVVNGYRVAPEILNLYAEARARQPFEQLEDEQRKDILNEALDLISLATDASRRGLDKDPEIAARMELQKLQVLVQASVNRFVEDLEIGDEDLRKAFDEQYVGEPKLEYKARHILLQTEEEALAVIEELKGGADFAELASQKSTGPSASNGGDLGWFSRDAMVKPFADAVAEMAEGDFSAAPVQTQFGFHVILAEGSRTAPAPDFESVKESLKAGVRQQRVQEFIEAARDAARIEVLLDVATEAPDANVGAGS